MAPAGAAACRLLADVDQGLHLRRGRVDGEGRLGARGLDRAAVAQGEPAATPSQLVRIDAVREPHIDSLLDAAVVQNTHGARVAGQGTKGRALRSDAKARARRVEMYLGEKVERGRGGVAENAGLAQIADDEGDRVDGTLRQGRMASDAVRHDTADAGLDRDDLQTVGVGGGSGQIRRVDSELDNGLADTSAGRPGAAQERIRPPETGAVVKVAPKQPFSALQTGNSASGVKRNSGWSWCPR